METDGFVSEVLDSGTLIHPQGPPLVKAVNPDLETEQAGLTAQMRELQIRRQDAQTREAALTQILDEEIGAVSEQFARNKQRLQGLQPDAPVSGIWVAPDIDQAIGRYLKRGESIGMVASLDDLRVRAVAGQSVAARLIKEGHQTVDMRVKGRPDITQTGRIEIILPAGQEELPSAALGYAAGGATQVDQEDPSGRQATEPFFEIRVKPVTQPASRIRPGQRVVLRFETLPKPLLVQGWRELLQIFQQRFNI
jgi:putative peptide zinc metalloprotease protein